MVALAKKPEERYNNASEMCEAIKNAVTTAKTYGDDIFSKISEVSCIRYFSRNTIFNLICNFF